MDPKDLGLNILQRERRQRGHDFQDEIRASWRLVPNTWQLTIKDGGGGSRPADKLVLCPEVNILQELKRTAGKKFELSFLEPNQLRGLVDFDQVIKRNYGLVMVSFHNPSKGLDEAYAIRITTALRFMQVNGRNYIGLDELRNKKDGRFAMRLQKLPGQGNKYDLRGLSECYKYL